MEAAPRSAWQSLRRFASQGPVQVGCLVGFVALVRVWWFATLPLIEQVTRIPDDAFYYLVLARNFATSGVWTFDQLSTTSGFHPLHAFVLAAISTVSPNAEFSTMLWATGLMAAMAMTSAAYLCARIVDERYGGFAVFAVVAVLTSPLILMQTTTLMESPWVILAGALCYRCMLPSSRWSLVAVACVGAFGSLARTDFGLLPLTLLVTASIVPIPTSVRRRLQLRLVVVLAGASLALALFLLYVHDYSGYWLQSSARMKSLWADTADSALQNYFLLLFAVVASMSTVVFAAAGLVQVAIGFAQKIWTRGGTEGEGSLAAPGRAIESSEAEVSLGVFTGSSGAVAVLGYVFFFGTQNLAPQTWYSAAFAVPLVLSIGFGTGACLSCAKISRGLRGVFAALVAVAAAGSLLQSQYARFPHQANMLGAALWLKEHPLDKRVAAFNAGVLSYFSEVDVVNLDGLVNDDVFEYARRNALVEYLDKREIGYVLDYPGMWEQASLQKRGGFSGGELNRRLRVAQRIEPLVPRARWLRAHPILMRIESRPEI